MAIQTFHEQMKDSNVEIAKTLDGRTVLIFGKDIPAIILSDSELIELNQGEIEGVKKQIRIYDDDVGPLIQTDTPVEIDGIEYWVMSKSVDGFGMMTLNLKKST